MLPGALRERPNATAKLVAGRLCLDFANSVGGWTESSLPRDDRLNDYADLVAWAWRAGLVDDAGAVQLLGASHERAREASLVAGRARRLRDAVHAIASSLEKGRPGRATDLQAITDEAQVARSRQRLEPSHGRLEWRIRGDRRALDAPLWPVALDAESYFTSGDLTRLHSCPGEDCGWLFEDTTRNRSRQWCDMRDCGNVAKLRRFRSKRRSSRP